MNRINIKSCPLCGDAQLKHLMTCTDFYSSGEKFELSRCDVCKFTFTQGFPMEPDIDRYYLSSDYISHTDTKKGIINRAYHQVRKHMLKKKVNLVLRQSRLKSGKLLDIGTGTGYFAQAMFKKGWEVDAVEKNKEARKYAAIKFGIDIQNEKSLVGFPPHTYDVITLWHVLEHLENLNEMWDLFFILLKEKGTLIIAVPNCTSYDAEKYGAGWAAYDVPRHLWHFSPATMEKIGIKHGFSLAVIRPMLFDGFYISMLSEKNKGNSLYFLRGLYTGTKAWLHSLADKEKSSSVIYIFRKQ